MAKYDIKIEFKFILKKIINFLQFSLTNNASSETIILLLQVLRYPPHDT